MSRILIAGCGYVGCALAEQLTPGGDEVWGLRRRIDDLPDGVRPLAADLSDPASLRRLPTGLDAVVYCAGAASRDEAAYRRAYVDGPTVLLRALEKHSPSPRLRLLFTSSTGVYGQDAGEWVDEESPTEPESFSGRVLLAGERVFAGSPYEAVVVRLAGIYGPGRDRLLRAVRDGSARRNGDRYTNRIHRDDCAGVLAHLLRLESPQARYVAVDDEPALSSEVVAWIAERQGEPQEDAVATVLGGGPPRGKRCSNRRLRASGFEPSVPTYREGYGAMLAAAPHG